MLHQHEGGLLREGETARRLGMKVRTLQKWRLRGEGPRYIVVGKRSVRYDPAELDRFIAAGMRRSTSDPGPAAIPSAPAPAPSPSTPPKPRDGRALDRAVSGVFDRAGRGESRRPSP